MKASAHSEGDRIATNRKAAHDYFILDRLEAGVALQGTEVKSLRAGMASLAGGFVRIDEGQALLIDAHIPPYEHGNRFNHDPRRPRRLLLHRKEIDRLAGQVGQRGYALIPLALYFRRGKVKLELGVCRGKVAGDKRETIRRRTAEREAERAIAEHR